jgi:hypothetical protein
MKESFTSEIIVKVHHYVPRMHKIWLRPIISAGELDVGPLAGILESLLWTIEIGHRPVTSDAEAALLKPLKREKRPLQTAAANISLWIRQTKSDLKK